MVSTPILDWESKCRCL